MQQIEFGARWFVRVGGKEKGADVLCFQVISWIQSAAKDSIHEIKLRTAMI